MAHENKEKLLIQHTFFVQTSLTRVHKDKMFRHRPLSSVVQSVLHNPYGFWEVAECRGWSQRAGFPPTHQLVSTEDLIVMCINQHRRMEEQSEARWAPLPQAVKIAGHVITWDPKSMNIQHFNLENVATSNYRRDIISSTKLSVSLLDCKPFSVIKDCCWQHFKPSTLQKERLCPPSPAGQSIKAGFFWLFCTALGERMFCSR